MDLTNKKVQVRFETGYQFDLVFLEKNAMEWTSLAKETKGQQAREKVTIYYPTNEYAVIN
ncbi:hypothetical protein [Bacillus sp. 03113]|uniref:hypothetical protein n=1 Tax=Bacillus sp. 03113 TaxID=2578211 RepID=UPI0011412957|nr:hypothetical protein [Bacillus sp. 03113]